MKTIHWLAVQPTPYNKHLFDALKKSKDFSFKLYYSLKTFKNLPFQEKLSDESDYFFKKTFGLDLSVIWKAVVSKDWFVCVGWDDPTKLLVLLLRGILGLPIAFWTDSINVAETKRSKIGFTLKKILLKGARVIFTTGEFGKQKMFEAGLVKDKSKVISLPFFVQIPENFKQKNNIIGSLELLLLARLIPRKGIDIALEAVRNLTNSGYNIKLKIGGIGELKEDIEKFINNNRQENNIELLGWLDNEASKKAKMEANLLIHTVTEHDPYPLVVLESLAFGLPVIGSSLAGSVADRVRDGFNGFVIKPEVTDLEETIIKCFDERLLQNMTINARKDAENWHTDLAINIIKYNLI